MTKHFYIKFVILVFLIFWLKVDLYAQTVLSSTEDVCAGELRQYKVKGSEGSIIYWSVQGGDVYDGGSVVIDQDLVTPGFQFSELVVSGESLIGILWNVTAGDYLVRAYEETAGSCVSANMDITVTVSSLPDQSLTLSDPSICSGGTASIILINSESGISYQLRLDSDNSNVGTAVSGTGGDITFNVTSVATTVYNVYAENLSLSCGVELDDKSTVTVEDNIDPTASDPAGISVQCVSDIPLADISVVTDEADNCTANPTVAFVSDVSDGNTCPELIVRTYSVTDESGNSINVTQAITINDTQAPTALCQDITVSMNAGGNASINAAQIDNGSYDACGIASISVSPSTFDSGDMFSTTIASSDGYYVYIKAYATSVNPVGNSCEWGYNYSVSIVYEISFSGVNIPANLYSLSGRVSCGNMYFGFPTTGGSGSVNTSTSWTNNTDCATVTPKSLGCNSIEISIAGPGIVSQTLTLANTANTVLTVTDNCGNTSTCNATVTLEDNIDPTASNPAAIIVQCTAPDPDITVVTDEADNCTVNPTVVFVSDVSDGNTSPELIVRTYSVTDESGNSINVTQTITINDTTDPVIPTLSDVSGGCSATATVPSTTDNCAGTITGTTTDPLTYNTQGTHVIVWTFDDGNGNTIVVNQNVVVRDVTSPVLADLSDLNIVDCADDESIIPQVKVLTGLGLNAGRYSDNCTTGFVVQYRIQLPDASFANSYGVQATGASLSSDPSGYEFPEGVSTVFFRVLDGSGNISNVESYTVSVNHKPNPSEINF